MPETAIPIVDLTPFRTGNAATKREAAKRVTEICEGAGFFYLSGHGVPPAMLSRIVDEARRFFALPLEQRQRIPATVDHYRGFMQTGARTYGPKGRSDLMEAFKMQMELPPDDPDLLAGKPLHQANKWPAGLPEWREALLDYYAEMDRVTHELLRVFALALDLEEDYFAPFFQKPLTQLSLLHYPPQPADTPEDQFGIRPHTDTSAFTLLLQDDAGGLQVRPVGQDWIDAVPIPGTYVVNIGNMMARWSNDRFISTPHRVINRSGRERFSVPFFANPDYDVVVECLPTCQSPANPARYEPLAVGPYMLERFTSNWKQPKAA
jgi:isopenicillin N synthase-like dioxygenase